MKSKLFCLLIILVGYTNVLTAQKKITQPFSPGREQMLKRYKAAEERDSLARRSIFKTSVTPVWTGSSAFWYRNALPDSLSEYLYIDPVKKVKRTLCDVTKISQALSAITGKPVNFGKIPIKDMYVYPEGGTIAIATGAEFYNVDLDNYSVTKIDTLPVDKTIYPGLTPTIGRWQRNRNNRTSPDKKWSFVLKENNIYLQPDGGGDVIAYTTDGTATLPYGEVSWSPDSRYLIAYKIKRVIYLSACY
jgi:hypothetical protein